MWVVKFSDLEVRTPVELYIMVVSTPTDKLGTLSVANGHTLQYFSSGLT